MGRMYCSSVHCSGVATVIVSASLTASVEWQGLCHSAAQGVFSDRKSNSKNTIIVLFLIIKNLLIGVYLGAYTGPVGRGFSRFFAMTRLGGAKRSLASRRWQTAVAFPYQPNLPTEALVDLKVRRRLGRFIPVWGWLKGLAVLRITVIPQR